jgi:WD40 repeat protein
MSLFLRFLPSGRLLISSDENGTVRVWDIKRQSLIASLRCSNSITGSPVALGKYLACVDERNLTIHLWDSSTFEEKQPIHIDSPIPLSDLRVNENGSVMVGIRENGSALIMDTKSWQIVRPSNTQNRNC